MWFLYCHGLMSFGDALCDWHKTTRTGMVRFLTVKWRFVCIDECPRSTPKICCITCPSPQWFTPMCTYLLWRAMWQWWRELVSVCQNLPWLQTKTPNCFLIFPCDTFGPNSLTFTHLAYLVLHFLSYYPCASFSLLSSLPHCLSLVLLRRGIGLYWG